MNMIRRPAAMIATSAPGFVLAWLVKVDAQQNETMVLVFEDTNSGGCTEQPLSAVKFMDGSPAVIPVIA